MLGVYINEALVPARDGYEIVEVLPKSSVVRHVDSELKELGESIFVIKVDTQQAA